MYKYNKQQELNNQHLVNRAIAIYLDYFDIDIVSVEVKHDKINQTQGIDRIITMSNDNNITIDDKIQRSVYLFDSTKKKNKLYFEIQRTYGNGYVSSGTFISDKKTNDFTVIITSDNYALIIDRPLFKSMIEDNIDSLIADYQVDLIHQKLEYDSKSKFSGYEYDALCLRLDIYDLEETGLIKAIEIIDLDKETLIYL